MGVVTASGGACDIIADRSSDAGHRGPATFAPETADAISPHLPSVRHRAQPARRHRVRAGQRARRARSPRSTTRWTPPIDDPGLDFVLFGGVNLPDAAPPDEPLAAVMDEPAGVDQPSASPARPIPVIPIGSTSVDIGPHAREVLSRHNVHVLGGLDLGMTARRQRAALAGAPRQRPAEPAAAAAARTATVLTERRAVVGGRGRDLLAPVRASRWCPASWSPRPTRPWPRPRAARAAGRPEDRARRRSPTSPTSAAWPWAWAPMPRTSAAAYEKVRAAGAGGGRRDGRRGAGHADAVAAASSCWPASPSTPPSARSWPSAWAGSGWRS